MASPLLVSLLTTAAGGILLLVRIIYLLLVPYGTRSSRGPLTTCHVAMFLGSGGHTTEMLQLLQALPIPRYTPRTYITASGDRFSVAKALEMERRIVGNDEQRTAKAGSSDELAAVQSFRFVTLPRARNVHQAWLSTPVSVLIAFFVSVYHIVLLPLYARQLRPRSAASQRQRLFADVILMNGPGTCVPIVAAVYILRIIGLSSPRLIYVESFARVRSLSLTAKVLRFFVDKFVMQWDRAIIRGAHYTGWLI